MRKIAILVLIIFVTNVCFGYADPPEGRGRGNNQGQQQNQGNNGNNGNNSNHGNGGNNRGENRSNNGSNSRGEENRLARAERQAIREQRRQERVTERRREREERTQVSEERGQTRSEVRNRRRDAANRRQNEIVLDRLNDALSSLRASQRARWSYNPVDDRPQGNRGNVLMQDPYGHARDNRFEETGNRGRPIREGSSDPVASSEPTDDSEPVVEAEPVTDDVPETDTSDMDPYFLELSNAVADSPAVDNIDTLLETAIEAPSVYDIAAMVQSAEAYQFVYFPGDTVEYDLMLQNPYETAITLDIATTIEYMNVCWTYNAEQGTYQRRNLIGTAVEGDSTETWQVTIDPGETMILSDTYYMPESAHWSNYQFHVTMTDAVTGATFDDPCVGWFDPPLDVAGAHRNNI